MQITLNKVVFDVKAVEAPLRRALLTEPVVAKSAMHPVWAWDKAEGKGRFLVPTLPDKALPLGLGIVAFVPKAGAEGAAVQKAEGPTAKMGERFLSAVGAQNMGQVMQALARITGMPRKKVPFEAFAALNEKGGYTLLKHTDFAILEMSNAARNLSGYVFVPTLVSFLHQLKEPGEGMPAPGSIRPGFLVPPGTEAVQAMRRTAVAQQMKEVQAELGDTKPSDLPPNDPRRAMVARLGAEWKVIQPKATKAA